MELNYFGTISLTKAVLPYMLKRKQGHIVVTSSVAGKTGMNKLYILYQIGVYIYRIIILKNVELCKRY